MKSMRAFAALALLASAAAVPAAAQEPADTPIQTAATPPGPRVQTFAGVELFTGAIAGAAAEREGTGTRGWGMQMTGGVGWRMLALRADLGFMDMGDERPFTEGTTEGDMTSSVAALVVSLAPGVRTPAIATGSGGNTFTGALNVGFTYLHASRSIMNCSDCTRQDVELQAGVFVEPGAVLTVGRGWGINARYRRYDGASDLRDAMIVGLSGSM